MPVKSRSLRAGGDVHGFVPHDGAGSARNPNLIGSVFLTADPAVANGDAVWVRVDAAGRLVVVGRATPADAASVPTDALNVQAILAALAPDAALDRLRTVGDTAALGLGVLAISPRTPGAGEVQTSTFVQTATETTRVTRVTPAAGMRVRVVSLTFSLLQTNEQLAEVYFGTGANIDTTPANAVACSVIAVNTTTDLSDAMEKPFPDGGGPIGDVDEVLSTRVDGLLDHRITISWREE